MRVDLYDGDWLVEIDGMEYIIKGDVDDGYDIIYDDEVIRHYNDLESCFVWCYRS